MAATGAVSTRTCPVEHSRLCRQLPPNAAYCRQLPPNTAYYRNLQPPQRCDDLARINQIKKKTNKLDQSLAQAGTRCAKRR